MFSQVTVILFGGGGQVCFSDDHQVSLAGGGYVSSDGYQVSLAGDGFVQKGVGMSGRQGKVSGWVCHGTWDTTHGTDTQWWPQKNMYSLQVVGTHPTGMLSCCWLIKCQLIHLSDIFQDKLKRACLGWVCPERVGVCPWGRGKVKGKGMDMPWDLGYPHRPDTQQSPPKYIQLTSGWYTSYWNAFLLLSH